MRAFLAAVAFVLLALPAVISAAPDTLVIRDSSARLADLLLSPASARLNGNSPLGTLSRPAVSDASRVEVPSLTCYPTHSDKSAGSNPIDCAAVAKAEVSGYNSCPFVNRAKLAVCTIKFESNGVANALSKAKAKGLMQLLDSTFNDMRWKYRMFIWNIFDPKNNMKAGIAYHDFLLKLFRCDVDKTIQAYNAGQGNVMRGIIPAETRAYHEKVAGCYYGTA